MQNGHWRWILLAGVLMAAPAVAADSLDAASIDAASVDAVARDYVELALGAQLLDPQLVSVNDPRPAELEKAKAAHRDAAAIARDAAALQARLDAIAPAGDALDAMRRRALRARLVSLEVQLQPAGATKPDVGESVGRQYGLVPDFPPLAGYDAALDKLAAEMPGEGSLPARIEAMKKAAIVPPDRIEPVFRAAITECRKRTAAHLALPAESIDLKFTDDPMFPAGAKYVGGNRSVVSVSRVVPSNIDQLLQMACHEVYPGHHVHFVTIDRELYAKHGWAEYAVELDMGPFVPVAEAVAEYGVGLAFPVEERLAYERDVLFPLAGLKMDDPVQWRAYLAGRSSMLGATATVARDFLSGAIDHDEAQRRFIRYRLQTPDAAGQLLKMMSVVGGYVIASDLGWYTIDRALQGKPVDEQWRLFQRIEKEPMLLQDIAALH